MGLILDLAVMALAATVIGSLALLTWTLAVTSTRAVREQRRRTADVRTTVTNVEGQLRDSADEARTTLAELVSRTTPTGEPPHR